MGRHVQQNYVTLPSVVVAGGSGNSLDHFHGQANFETPVFKLSDFLRDLIVRHTPIGEAIAEFTKPVLADGAWLKVHERQGPDIAPIDASGKEYHVEGGFQDGRTDRLAFNVDMAFLDHDGSLAGSAFGVDLDISAAKDMFWYDDYDPTTGTLSGTFDDGSVGVLNLTGNGALPGATGWESFNNGFLLDHMYDSRTGEAWNGTDAADLWYSARTIDEGPIASIPMLGGSTIETSVHILASDPFATA